MVGIGIGTLSLFAHVVNLQGQDTQTVNRPGRALRVDGSIRPHMHIRVFLTEVRVYLLHQVCTVLVAAVYAPLELQGLQGVNVRVAYDVLKMPLHRIYPALQVQAVLDRVSVVRVVNRGINIVLDVIIADSLVEYTITLFSKRSHVFSRCVIC